MKKVQRFLKKAVIGALVISVPVIAGIASSVDDADAYAGPTIECKVAENTCLEAGPVRAEGRLVITTE